MITNLRKQISHLKDSQILGLAVDARITRNRLNQKFVEDGSADVDEVKAACEKAEIGTVARAIGKKRVVSGNEGSHRSLQSETIGTSPKKLASSWGKWLSDRRRV